jgi:WXXGXW repeat (2 copies)
MTRIRNATRHATHALPVVSLVIAAACASNPPYPDHDRDRDRDHATTTDANGDARNQRRDDAGRYAHKPPPADVVENPNGQPGPQYVWVVGHYSWDGNDFQWHAGQWAMPPNGYHNWRAGHWDQVDNNNWSYTEGQWQ